MAECFFQPMTYGYCIHVLWNLFFLWLSSGRTTDCTPVFLLHNKLMSFRLIPSNSQELPYKIMISYKMLRCVSPANPEVVSLFLAWHPETVQVLPWGSVSIDTCLSQFGWAPGLCCWGCYCNICWVWHVSCYSHQSYVLGALSRLWYTLYSSKSIQCHNTKRK